ncbi:hypothetical protein DYB30_005558 [Aphanomyces astaci]|uniref:START domain-containing protein n=1 Tax=Aphanomyces astaci TaxID=112090 RepID=A0A397CUM8_APHAT|nr:hypothetical protein DYB30_005558 [Aphanomyces astaci]
MEVRGTDEEVAELFYPDDEPLANLRRVFPDLLDAQTIYTLNLPSARAPRHYISMQWMAFESPSPVMKHRDFCVLESLTSIKTPRCPDLDPSSGVVRGSMARTGCIFMEMTDAPGRLEATYFVQMDFHGSAPKAMHVHGMRQHIRAILPTVESFILIARLRDAAFLAKLVPTSARRTCHCGDAVCTSCSSHVTFDQHLDSLKLRICTACVMHVLLPDEFPNPTRSSSHLHHDSNDDG